jgi:hypothetical protein|tara:strand:- start:195 stop:395 length:201 start_codon:yes stop_codon:yes gene_type:complete
MNTKNWDKQISRYRVIEHQLGDKSVFIVEWNDKWFFGIWGKWHQKFHSLSLEEAIKKIHRLVKIKN